jgi:putative ABC transport system permease protein
MMQDFKFAFRQLVKTPAFTTIAILTLAIAIGVNSGVFALINGVVLKPIVRVRPAEVVNLFSTKQNAKHDYRQFSHAEYEALRASTDVFADVTAVNFALAGIGRDEGMRRSFAFLTSENFFSLMGVEPAQGRFYNAEECRPNANIPVVVVSHGFWKRMGTRPDLVGSTLFINGQKFTVIGIAPEGFSGISALIAPDVWLPLGIFSQLKSAFSDSSDIQDLAQSKNYTLNIVARLRSGLTMESAKPRLPVLAQRLTDLQPADSAGGAREIQIEPPSRFSISTTPSDDGPVTVIGALLMGMAAAVLLIASLNLANMLLARGTARSKEIALRLALGASRWRIVRQLLSEGLLLAVAGGAIGLILSAWGNGLLIRSLNTLFTSMNFSIVLNMKPNVAVLIVTFLFCLLATLLFSLGPALKASRADLVNDLKQQAGEPAHIGRFNRFFAPRHILVMAQISLSLMLLFSAGLFFRGALAAAGVSLGFEPAGGIVTEMDFSLGTTDDTQARRLIFSAIERVRALPGVRAVGLGTMVPYGNFTNARRIMPANQAPVTNTDPNAPDPGAGGLFTAVTPGYFESVGVRLLRGRDFTISEAENKDSPRVAIIDEKMADKLFPNGDALGQRIRYTQAPTDGSPAEMEVVGIVNWHRHEVQNDGPQRRLFVPLAHAFNGNVYLHVRCAATDQRSVAAMIPVVRQTLRNVDPDLPILKMTPFTDLLEKNVGLWIVRLGAVLFGAFGLVALLLAVVGVYGVKSYAVARRTREIGIRMALGAHPRDVFSLIMKQGALQTSFALGIGLLLALAAGQLLSQILYQVSPTDPAALIASSLMLSGAALLACYLPARRATRVSPMTALRTE